MTTRPQPSRFDVLTCPLDGINLVEASAGTGKTWNICGLYLRLLLERRLDVRQILVVTFTNAATAELRERVRARIVEMLAYANERPIGDDPFVRALAAAVESRGVQREDMRQRLDLALQTFDEAAILTIHGWCQRALAETPFASGQPFTLDIQPDDAELRLAAVHDFWRRHIAGDGCPPALAAWLDAKRVAPETLSKLLARHLAKPLARVRWPEAIDAPLDLDFDALQAAFDAARATWTAAREEILAVVQDAMESLNRTSYKDNTIPQSTAEWDAWFAHDVLSPIKWKESKLERLAASCLKKNTKKGGRTPRHLFFDQADALIDARKSAEAELERARMRLVRTLFEEAAPALRAGKRDARLASYDDLLRNLHDALHAEGGTTLARSLREQYPTALIDEFQDTDPVQFAIFRSVYGSGESPLFLVGDPKQAIYGFRHADLHTYLQAARTVTSAWTLAQNQRSTPGLIAAVNRLFASNPRAFMLDGLAYHEVQVGAKKRAVLEEPSGNDAALRIWTLPRFDGGAPLERRAALDASAAATAAEVARLLRASAAGEIMLDHKPLAPHDIAVLVRTHRQGDDIKQALAALGVGSVELSQATVFKSPDAEDVERMLAAILDPGDDGLLRGALATEIVGLDAGAIAALAHDESAFMEHVQRFLDYRRLWQDAGVGVMFREMLAKEHVAKRMLARPDGERRLTNLLHLGELLHAAAETHRAPDALLRWLNAQRRDDARDEVAQLRLESDRNLVQIVTIHKVKGLEYPIVFCPFLWDAFRPQAPDRLDGLEYHADDGVAVVDFRSEDELGGNANAIKDRVKLEKCAEDLRLIYVALTRASHRCYLVAGCYGRKSSGTNLSSKETRSGLLSWLAGGTGIEPGSWLAGDGATVAIDDAWARLAREVEPHVVCSALPMEPGEPVSPARIAPGSLAALPPPARIVDAWYISSFSGLLHGAVSESAANDRDARSEVVPSDADAEAWPTRAPAPPNLALDDILRFPRGVGAGDCLHAALERVDFTDPRSFDSAIARALRAHPQSLPGLAVGGQQAVLHRMIARMIGDLVQTDLHQGIRLDAVVPPKRLTELEFALPARQVAAPALNAALKSLGYAADRLTFARLQGYLKGYVDLVFEHAGRYYLVDWKSNHLGYTPADYAPSALEIAMRQHGYHLQSLIYAVALTRYLARRIPGYSHETHFGGALYVFLRGVRPGWKSADGSAAGVYFHRAPAQTLAAIDRLLHGDSAGATRPRNEDAA